MLAHLEPRAIARPVEEGFDTVVFFSSSAI